MSAVGFLVYKMAGMLDEECIILMHHQVKRFRSSFGETIRHLFGEDFAKEIEEAMKSIKSEDRRVLKRLLNYSSSCANLNGRQNVSKSGNSLLVYEFWQKLMGDESDTEKFFLESVEFLTRLLQDRIDPFRLTGIDVNQGWIPQTDRADIEIIVPERISSGSKIFITLPVVKAGHDEQEIIKSADKAVYEEEIFSLVDCPVVLAVVGPPGSGKSSFVASLSKEMQNVFDSLATREGFPQLVVQPLDLDAASPTLDLVFGKARERKKQDWSWELTIAMVDDYKRFIKERKANIYILDIPGRASEFSLVLVGLADAAVIITKDWDAVTKEWRPLLQAAGVYEVGHFKSRTLKEIGPLERAYTSVIKGFIPGKLISGRIVGLERVLGYCCDPVVWVGARLLIFDILPEIIRKKKTALKIMKEGLS